MLLIIPGFKHTAYKKVEMQYPSKLVTSSFPLESTLTKAYATHYKFFTTSETVYFYSYSYVMFWAIKTHTIFYITVYHIGDNCKIVMF